MEKEEKEHNELMSLPTLLHQASQHIQQLTEDNFSMIEEEDFQDDMNVAPPLQSTMSRVQSTELEDSMKVARVPYLEEVQEPMEEYNIE